MPVPDNLTPAATLAIGAGILLLLTGIVADLFVLVRLRRRPLTSPEFKRNVRLFPWNWQDAILVLWILLATYVTVVLVSGFLAPGADVGEAPAAPLPTSALVLQMLAFPLVGLITVVCLVYGRRLSWHVAFGFERRRIGVDVRHGLALYVAAVPVVTFYTWLYVQALEHLNQPVYSQDVITLLADPTQPLAFKAAVIALAVLIAPVMEEFVFRGIVLTALAKHIPPLHAAYTVSFTFALIHGHVPSIVPLFVIAMAFSVAYLTTRSILVPIVMHALFNAVSLAAVFLLKDTPLV